MIDIEKIKPEIIERLKPLNPDKIILFGSYAYGIPNEDSDIDLFIFKDIDRHLQREYKLKARQSIRTLISKYKVGFDLLVASETFVKSRKDYFYKKDILENGKIIYE
ncbi:nucleotidyltransferase domain-containing protein [Sulfurimonas sp.]|uniref:nucleotidyltransferase domain-containing protein n=1 Tax=Sulfurimonas sp. TaxID=2022749 RepID=UPI002AB1B31D|nr:nucleotidyltransferase domain-containing protein [Sulfurimonas sp.]